MSRPGDHKTAAWGLLRLQGRRTPTTACRQVVGQNPVGHRPVQGGRKRFPPPPRVPAGPARRGDKLEILAHTHPAGSTDRFGAELADRAVRTPTYVAGDQTKAIASVFAL